MCPCSAIRRSNAGNDLGGGCGNGRAPGACPPSEQELPYLGCQVRGCTYDGDERAVAFEAMTLFPRRNQVSRTAVHRGVRYAASPLPHSFSDRSTTLEGEANVV